MGAGQLFQELVRLQLREANKKERNKEVGIPRAEIPDMPWDCAKEQNRRGRETPARASQMCPQGIHRVYRALGGNTWGLGFCCQRGVNLPAMPWSGVWEKAPGKTQHRQVKQ